MAAATAGVPQDSERWDQLCDQLGAKLQSEAKASDTERGWWQSKGFKV